MSNALDVLWYTDHLSIKLCDLALLLIITFQNTVLLHVSYPPQRLPSSIFSIGPSVYHRPYTYQDVRLRGTRARKASTHSDAGRTWQNSTHISDDGGEWLYRHRHHWSSPCHFKVNVPYFDRGLPLISTLGSDFPTPSQTSHSSAMVARGGLRRHLCARTPVFLNWLAKEISKYVEPLARCIHDTQVHLTGGNEKYCRA